MMNTKEVKEDKQIVFIKNLFDVFKGVQGAKNVNIVVWKHNFDNGYNGKQHIYNIDGTTSVEKLKRTNKEIEKPTIICNLAKHVMKNAINSISFMISVQNPYGICSEIFNNPKKYGISTSLTCNNNDVCLHGLKQRRRTSFFVERNALPRISDNLDSYKVFIPQAWGNMSPTSKYLGGSYSETIVSEPGDCCTGTYLEFGPFDSYAEAEAANVYLHTKFLRALLFRNKYTHHSARQCYAVFRFRILLLILILIGLSRPLRLTSNFTRNMGCHKKKLIILKHIFRKCLRKFIFYPKFGGKMLPTL